MKIIYENWYWVIVAFAVLGWVSAVYLKSLRVKRESKQRLKLLGILQPKSEAELRDLRLRNEAQILYFEIDADEYPGSSHQKEIKTLQLENAIITMLLGEE